MHLLLFLCNRELTGRVAVLGGIQHKITVNANDDTYNATRKRMTLVKEQEQKTRYLNRAAVYLFFCHIKLFLSFCLLKLLALLFLIWPSFIMVRSDAKSKKLGYSVCGLLTLRLKVVRLRVAWYLYNSCLLIITFFNGIRITYWRVDY